MYNVSQKQINVFDKLTFSINVFNRANNSVSFSFVIIPSFTRVYGGGYSIIKLSFKYIIWWGHFECGDEWTPESKTIILSSIASY